jgi:hypothetical protein
MTKAEYAEYESSVNAFLAGVEFVSTADSYPEGCIEPHFSWSYCEVCQRPEGGDRYDMQGVLKGTDTVVEFTACEDCNYYIEYGRLGNRAMLEIEAA